MKASLSAFSREVVGTLPVLFREFAKREDNALTRGKISFPQMVTLHLLCQRSRVPMNDLAKVLSVRCSSATVLVDRLIRQRMVIRNRDEEDRRIVWIQITSRGRKVVLARDAPGTKPTRMTHLNKNKYDKQ